MEVGTGRGGTGKREGKPLSLQSLRHLYSSSERGRRGKKWSYSRPWDLNRSVLSAVHVSPAGRSGHSNTEDVWRLLMCGPEQFNMLALALLTDCLPCSAPGSCLDLAWPAVLKLCRLPVSLPVPEHGLLAAPRRGRRAWPALQSPVISLAPW